MLKISKLATTAAVASAAAAALVLALSLSDTQPDTQLVSTAAKNVYTWNCEYPDQRPREITIMCADGGIFIENIKWSKWSATGAAGTGTLGENLCEPSCAEGEFVYAPVNLSLTQLSTRKGKQYLRTLDITTQDGNDFPWGKTSGFQWDVMEFAERMNWDE